MLAADAVLYLPDLVPLVLEAARVLRPGGVLAFTTETHGGAGVVLGTGLRSCHGADHVRSAITVAGLLLCVLAPISTRKEKGEPVPGLVVTAVKR